MESWYVQVQKLISTTCKSVTVSISPRSFSWQPLLFGLSYLVMSLSMSEVNQRLEPEAPSFAARRASIYPTYMNHKWPSLAIPSLSLAFPFFLFLPESLFWSFEFLCFEEWENMKENIVEISRRSLFLFFAAGDTMALKHTVSPAPTLAN